MLQSPAEVQKRKKRSQIMLDIRFENDYAQKPRRLKTTIVCDVCKVEASIFQDEGNFCLECWQQRTEPNISC